MCKKFMEVYYKDRTCRLTMHVHSLNYSCCCIEPSYLYHSQIISSIIFLPITESACRTYCMSSDKAHLHQWYMHVSVIKRGIFVSGNYVLDYWERSKLINSHNSTHSYSIVVCGHEQCRQRVQDMQWGGLSQYLHVTIASVYVGIHQHNCLQ